MNNDFDNMVEKIIKAIKEIDPSSSQEEIHKSCILYVLIKLCESEEILKNNMLILDKESENGLNANYQKKFKR